MDVAADKKEYEGMSRKGLFTDVIIEAAAEIISEKGFDKFSLRELAEKLSRHRRAINSLSACRP